MLKNKLLSRKLWMAVMGAALVPLLIEVFGVDQEVAISMAGVIASYILGQAVVDASEVRK